MPRDGANVYHRPVGIDAIANRTIESAKYNLNVSDVEQDLNTPRPVVAGGTGASSAAGARTNLQAERAMATVTNYSTNVSDNGSFWSDVGANAAPVAGHRFVGTAQIANNNPDFITLTARDMDDTATPGTVWVAEKFNGLWSSWSQDVSGSVPITGGTLTGPLIGPEFTIDNG